MKSEITKKRDYFRMLPYGITLRKDKDGDWVARVSELPGCTAHGSTQAESLKNLDEVMDVWLEDALISGTAIPAPQVAEQLPSGKWLQRVPRSLHKKLADLAERDDVSLNQLVTSILSEAVGRRNGPGPLGKHPRTPDEQVIASSSDVVSFVGTGSHKRQHENAVVERRKRAVCLD